MTRHSVRPASGMRAVSAVIGTCALVAMAALGLLAEHPASAPATAAPAMTVGATSRHSTPATTPNVGIAKPALRGPAPLPSEEAAAK